MPTPEEIKKIAREYAEEYSPKEYIDPILREKAVELNSNIFEGFLQHLLKTHCIVPKDIVIKAYENTYPNDIGQSLSGIMQASMLREIFGKELFNKE